MSSALPRAIVPDGSTSRTSETRSRSASACATAPPSAPQPTIAMKPMGVDYSNGMSGLAGTAALVTGGSRGIGLSIAKAFVASGAQVAITGRNQSHLDAAAKMLGERAYALQADVSKPDDASRAVDAAASRFGGLDVLVNNAGVGLMRPVAELSVADWRQTLDTN